MPHRYRGWSINMPHYAFTCGSPPPWSLLTQTRGQQHYAHQVGCGQYIKCAQYVAAYSERDVSNDCVANIKYQLHVSRCQLLSSLSRCRFAAELNHPPARPPVQPENLFAWDADGNEWAGSCANLVNRLKGSFGRTESCCEKCALKGEFNI